MPRSYQIKYCRHCGRIIPLDSAECVYCGKLVIRSHEQKLCAFCGEPVKAQAVKCKHCGEFLDGRAAQPPDRQQIVHIERAIIAAPREGGEVELLRPDGKPLDLRELGSAPRGELPAGKAAAHEETSRDLPARVSGAQPPARTKAGPVARPEKPGAAVAPAAAGPAAGAPEKPVPPPPPTPPVEMECPVCKRPVFHGDHYCENCGRDLSLRKGETTVRPIAYPYRLTDYALILSAASPLGLLLTAVLSLVLPAAGTLLGGVCIRRIMTSGGRLKGMGAAVAAVALGLFWFVVMLVAKVF